LRSCDLDVRGTDEVGEEERLTADFVYAQVRDDGVGQESDEMLSRDLFPWIDNRSMSFSFNNALAAANFVSIPPC